MLLIETKKRCGLPYSLEEVTQHLQTNKEGYIYMVDNTKRINTDATLRAYRILRDEETMKDMVVRLQYTLLDIANTYGNTYWHAKTLLSIFPDLVKLTGKESNPATITLKGKENRVIKIFPHQEVIEEKELKIIHTTGMPIFLTTTQEGVTTQELVESSFTVRTWFEEGDTLQQGIPTQLYVEVNQTASHENYLMVEVPIPAGCVYDSKPNTYRNETHREYFKEKTVIFFERLYQGKHIITIPLIPHFEGVYHMNPAKVSKMYTPQELSTNDIRKVTIVK
ncbi:MAG: hypothetical protein LIP01_03390 [Tannerellaceae bacterium]|nr:hypothetical protein [Tannerellaceae bacterium]